MNVIGTPFRTDAEAPAPGGPTAATESATRRPELAEWERAKVGDRLGSFGVLLPAQPAGPVVLAVELGIADVLRRRYADVVARISFWDLNDGQSWLNSFPWQRVNYPLLFDRQGLPKPAFGAVVKALGGASPK